MKILFLDQSGKSGGAELCLADLAAFYRDRALVGLFEDGPFQAVLSDRHIPVEILAKRALEVRKDSGIWKGVQSIRMLIPLIARVAQLARPQDVIYANTQKALVVGAIASAISRRPLVYHLHDILSLEHFSRTNRTIAVTCANRAALVIANSEASRAAFIDAGGRSDTVQVVYNGFELSQYQPPAPGNVNALRSQLGLEGKFVVGHFSRLSPWKGQHVLIEALTQCPDEIVAIFVGDALFGEQAYVEQLRQQVETAGLRDRVTFLGFRSDVIPLMQLCHVVAHTSTAAEPFGRVIVEAMLCGTPIVAAQAGGALELVEPGVTGWLTPPGNASALAQVLTDSWQDPETARAIAAHAEQTARDRFNLDTIHHQIEELLSTIVQNDTLSTDVAPSNYSNR